MPAHHIRVTALLHDAATGMNQIALMQNSSVNPKLSGLQDCMAMGQMFFAKDWPVFSWSNVSRQCSVAELAARNRARISVWHAKLGQACSDNFVRIKQTS